MPTAAPDDTDNTDSGGHAPPPVTEELRVRSERDELAAKVLALEARLRQLESGEAHRAGAAGAPNSDGVPKSDVSALGSPSPANCQPPPVALDGGQPSRVPAGQLWAGSGQASAAPQRPGRSSEAPSAGDAPLPPHVAKQLCELIPALAGVLPADACISTARLAECFGALVGLMRMLDRTVLAQLAALGKYNARIREMSENLDKQHLLDIDSILCKSFAPGTPKTLDTPPPRQGQVVLLRNYCDLLLRWVSAVLVGTQGTILDVSHRLSDALNWEKWNVPKGGFFKSEESIYWSFYKEHVKPNLPLEFEDQVKRVCGDKIFEAYGAIRGRLMA
jgi:hypothetical protein